MPDSPSISPAVAARGLPFCKLTAAGNDFLCVDNSDGRHDALFTGPAAPEVVRRLCRHGLGVGADGVIVARRLPRHPLADVQARFLEPDGSEAELCGNGTACCAAWWLEHMEPGLDAVTLLTAAGMARGRRSTEGGGRIRVCIPQPRDLQPEETVEVEGRTWTLTRLTIGVPHAMVFVDDVGPLDVARWGGLLRWHPRFAPRGINVNFTQVLGEGEIAVRTFEFGVEAETLACGTGSASAAIITTLARGWNSGLRSGETPVLVQVRGGETLKVWFEVRGAPVEVTDVCLETRVRTVYDGVVRPQFLTGG